MAEILWVAAIAGAWGVALWLGWKMGAQHGRRRLSWRMRLAGWRAVASSLWRHRGNRREMALEVQAEQAQARAEAAGGRVPLDEEGRPRLAYLVFRPRTSSDMIDLLDPHFSDYLTAEIAERFLWVGREGWLEFQEPGAQPMSVKAVVTGHDELERGMVHANLSLVQAWPPGDSI